MSQPVVLAVHGFLGRSTDWDSTFNFLQGHIQLIAPDLFVPTSRGRDLLSWLPSITSNRKIFVGYSYGGRLGLRFLSDKSDSFDHYIFVSTNPGLPSDAIDERQKRLHADRDWASRIKAETWNQFILDWNSQPVFKGGQVEPIRDGSQYDYELLQKALLENSLALQPDYRALISQHKSRITWVVGERDTKFVALTKSLKEEGCIDSFETLDSGHRILNENPSALAGVIQKTVEFV